MKVKNDDLLNNCINNKNEENFFKLYQSRHEKQKKNKNN